jgi:hypothetical protein
MELSLTVRLAQNRSAHRIEANISGVQDMRTETAEVDYIAIGARASNSAGADGPVHAAKRCARAAAPGAAVGPRRQGLPVRHRHRRREGFARRSLPRALAASRLSFHVRAGLQGELHFLLVDRRRLQRHRSAPREPRRDALGGIAGAACEAEGVQGADGLDLSLGVIAGGATSITTSTSPSAKSSSAAAALNTITVAAATR